MGMELTWRQGNAGWLCHRLRSLLVVLDFRPGDVLHELIPGVSHF